MMGLDILLCIDSNGKNGLPHVSLGPGDSKSKLSHIKLLILLNMQPRSYACYKMEVMLMARRSIEELW